MRPAAASGDETDAVARDPCRLPVPALVFMMPDILYLDNHLLVVNKPAGMLVQGDRTGDPTLLTWGKAYLKTRFEKPGNVYLSLVQRLDRPVSGVMVLARTSKAAARLTDQFKRRRPEKGYLAIVEGDCAGIETCVDYLVKAQGRVRVVDASHPRARRAALRWQAVARRDGLSLLIVHLETGRPHQVRVQCAQRGYPLLGDLRYGARRRLDRRSLALHCFRLVIDHPTRRTALTFTAPPPPAWDGYFNDEIKGLLAR